MRATGLAMLTVITPGPGKLSLRGPSVVSRRVPATAGSSSLLIAAKGRAARALRRTGRAIVLGTVTFAPTAGEPISQRLKVRLTKRR